MTFRLGSKGVGILSLLVGSIVGCDGKLEERGDDNGASGTAHSSVGGSSLAGGGNGSKTGGAGGKSTTSGGLPGFGGQPAHGGEGLLGGATAAEGGGASRTAGGAPLGDGGTSPSHAGVGAGGQGALAGAADTGGSSGQAGSSTLGGTSNGGVGGGGGVGHGGGGGLPAGSAGFSCEWRNAAGAPWGGLSGTAGMAGASWTCGSGDQCCPICDNWAHTAFYLDASGNPVSCANLSSCMTMCYMGWKRMGYSAKRLECLARLPWTCSASRTYAVEPEACAYASSCP